MSHRTALARFQRVVGLWYVGQASGPDVVLAACDLLVAELDGQALSELAAVPLADAGGEVPELLEPVLTDLGIPFYPPASPAAVHAGLIAMATETVLGAMEPRALTAWAHETFGHQNELTDGLADLDDIYATAVAANTRPEDIDEDVIEEAWRILARENTGDRAS
ncbi:hypothetical protein FR943_08330 [Mycobacterium sp. TNTM28]|uniref:DUF4259 domain-containing protein n=1 Tax=[Mycobacterium] fortunisiensis TaxID=2600579 RepID=A0ABS6KJT9_9MYCO|nr:hypothetical protein [[Mycobacterium] fortunisiensis]MBU9763848.1 hypothetical protein [[Mycobacterium] fortunisiensis]